ncbi:Uncharacterised protein [uncultured archaeon]|nr:Uncharacterised protein [uncultured archaeon]
MEVHRAYVLFMLAFNLLILAAPLLAMSQSPIAGALYSLFELTCHQLPERSFCLSGSLSIGDCAPSFPYQFPVCSRDMAIYIAMLIGGLAMPFLYDVRSRKTPSIWILVLAAVPVAIDGGTQLFGMRESTNFFRMLTGAIIGFVIPFFLIPLINDFTYVVSKRKSDRKRR